MSYAEIRAKSSEDLIREYDELAKNTVVGTAFYLEELRRREADRQAKTMIMLTRFVALLSIVITALTAVNLWAVIKLK